MKNWKTFTLTLIIAIGFMFPSCQNDEDIDCGGISLPFFNITGIEEAYFYDNSDHPIQENTTVLLNELNYLSFWFSVDYQAMLFPKVTKKNSFLNTLNACTPILGGEGSKDEELANFSIITLNDFDENHLAGDTINDLFDYVNRFNEGEPLPEPQQPLMDFLTNQTGTIKFNNLILNLNKAPEINMDLKLKLVVALSTEEIYELEMKTIKVLPN